jgi:TolB-like protein/DNA-binding winged helix-turn-helix (wHTH) protein/Flp pilus assembly protein TadD
MSSTTETVSSLRPFRVGDWLVEPSLNRLSSDDATAQLDLKSMELLLCLAEHAGEVVPTQQLVDSVWQVEVVAAGTLTHAMAELRKALGDDAREPTYIETIPKRGYRLIAPVAFDEVEGADDEPASRRPLVRLAGWSLFALAAALLLVVSVVVWRSRQAPPPEATPPEPKRVVVLPFLNLGAPEDENFADGMTVELINRLATVSGLHVISNTTAMKYKGSRKSIPEIGDELGVQYALEGEVRWEPMAEGAGRVRISPQLILIAEDRNIWTDQFDRDVESIIAVQSEIARRVIEQLDVALLEPEVKALDARPTDNMDAYNAYLRGLANLGMADPERIRLAIAMFGRAVELDPEFALAHAMLSYGHSLVYRGRSDLDRERMTRAKRAADRALELDPNLPEGHTALGVFYGVTGDRERALAEYRTSLDLRPNQVEVLGGVALLQATRGQWQEAVNLLQRAVELDPQNSLTLGTLAWTYQHLRRYQEAADIVGRAIAIAPDAALLYNLRVMIYLSWYGPTPRNREVLVEVAETFPDLELLLCVSELHRRNYEAALACFDRNPQQVFAPGAVFMPVAYFESECYERMGEPDLARQRLEQARVFLEGAADTRPEDYGIQSALGLVYGGLRRTDDAIRQGERAVALLPVSKDAVVGPNLLMNLALIYANVGERDAALDTIDHLLSIPGEVSVAWLHSSMWDTLRDHPRFAEILEKYEHQSVPFTGLQ